MFFYFMYLTGLVGLFLLITFPELGAYIDNNLPQFVFGFMSWVYNYIVYVIELLYSDVVNLSEQVSKYVVKLIRYVRS